MAKDKKNISDFSKALLSNSQFIGKDMKKSEFPKRNQGKKPTSTAQAVEIEPEIFIELEKLAREYKTDLKKFTNIALKHFLRIEYIRQPK